MKKPNHLNKYNFEDFPKEYYLKTYLGSKVLVVYYDSSQDTVEVWQENNVFMSCNKENLLASEEEICKAAELLWEETKSKSKIDPFKTMMEYYRISAHVDYNRASVSGPIPNY